ncbi:hypothetical protein TRAPUB_892 [Trametes pubescens]|uniref:F-box domain-containing protein n=1 Tax=Trametes pubescens TaxID=154538 RepID=A0A1M2VKX5_TRAPU|nr:hypothetical protein TRAPUB_892 [Trametes pubescens]
MSRFETYFHQYPPRAPLTPPPAMQSSPIQHPFKVRTRSWTSHVLQPRSASTASHDSADRASESPFWPGPTFNIQDLPLELLIHIFIPLAELENGTARAEIRHVRGIAYLMFVCRRWRALIVDTALFWRYITITTPQNDAWVSLCLERTRNCLLDLQVFSPGYASPDLLALVLPHASCIRTFIGHLDTKEQQSILLGPFFDTGFPALERLELQPIHPARYGYYPAAVDHALERGTAPGLSDMLLVKTS